MAAEPRKRPFGVVIRAWLVIFVGAILTLLATIGVLAAIAAVGLGLADVRLLLVGILVLVLAIFVLVAGIGLYNLRPWAWWLATVVTLAALVYTGVGLYQAMTRPGGSGNLDLGSAFTVAFLGVLFAYLLTVRNRFRRPIAI